MNQSKHLTANLPDKEIHLFVCQPEQISDPELLSQYAELLSEQERSRLPRFHHQRHRHQYLVTRALQRHCLSVFSEIQPQQWQFETGTYGKPVVDQPEHQNHLSFNLSHTNGLVVCAITRNTELGVDVEDQQRSTRAAYDQLFSYFSKAEIAQLEQLPQARLKRRFFEHWTLKEAYIKARGAGFAIPLKQFGFLFEQDHPAAFFVDPSLNDNATDWQFWQGDYTQRYTIALALHSRFPDQKLITHECVPLQSTHQCSEIEFLRLATH